MPTTIVVSYSELDTYRQCPYKHALAYRERWVSPKQGPALSRGTRTHAVLEDHYRYKMRMDEVGGVPPLTVDEECKRLVAAHCSDDSEEADLVAWMIEGYLQHYGWDENWRVLAVEHAPEFWLPTDRGGRSRFRLKMKIDLIVQDRRTGHLWIIDHKTCRDLPKSKELDIDDQFGLYGWGMRALGRPSFGQVHNALRTQRNVKPMGMSERFSRTQMSRTDAEMDAIAVDAYRTARLAYRDTDALQAGRSPDPDRCGWRCDYTDPCLFGRKKNDPQQTRVFLRSAGFVQDFQRH